jgi:5'-AMP-activated protein kinase catalytic alpha subunit
VKVIDVLDVDDSMYIVMEQVVGGDLFDYLVKHVRLKEAEARRLFQQIIDGVDHCHSARVVHRDLKAENILLDEDRNVKIADFGFAAQTTPGEPLTKSCGSPNYAAPELLYKGCSYEGPEIDVWSCGVILYALLTIRLPFDAPNIPDLFRLIKKGSYTVPGYVSADAKDLISRMLTIDPKDRISVAEIKQHKWFSVGLQKEEALLAVAEPAVIQEEAPAVAQPAVAKTPKFGKRRSNILPPSMLPEKKDRNDQRSPKVGLRTRVQSAAQVNRKGTPTRSEYSASCGTLGMLPTKFVPAMMVC